MYTCERTYTQQVSVTFRFGNLWKIFFSYLHCGTNSFVERLCKKKLISSGPKRWHLALDENQAISVLSIGPHLERSLRISVTCIFLCFSVVHRDSFDAIKQTYQKYSNTNSTCHKLLIGLNADIRTSKTTQKILKKPIISNREESNFFAKLPKGI
jgi:hypothetical protein